MGCCSNSSTMRRSSVSPAQRRPTGLSVRDRSHCSVGPLTGYLHAMIMLKLWIEQSKCSIKVNLVKLIVKLNFGIVCRTNINNCCNRCSNIDRISLLMASLTAFFFSLRQPKLFNKTDCMRHSDKFQI